MKNLTYALLLMILFACSDEDLSMPVSPVGGIDLANLTPGSSSDYILYASQCGGGFTFTGDTLNVSVVEENDTLYLEERYTEGSEQTFTSRHAVFPEAGYVLIPQRAFSQFLFFYGNDTIFLDRDSDVDLIQNGCRLSHGEGDFVGEEIGSVEEFQVGSVHISNKKAVSCVPTFFEIDAYIFYTDNLSAVHVIQKGETDSIIGFVAIN